MKRKLAIFAAMLAAFAGVFSGCGEGEPPIKVQTYTQANPLLGWAEIRFLEISAIVDSVTIMEIKPNRGKCKVGSVPDSRGFEINETLQYGQSRSFPIAKCKNLLEVEVKTDKGTFTFYFK